MTVDNGSAPESADTSILGDETPTTPIDIQEVEEPNKGTKTPDESSNTAADQPITGVDPLTRRVADGIVLGWAEIRDDVLEQFRLLIAHSVELSEAAEAKPKPQQYSGPFVAYDYRRHTLLWVLELALFIGGFGLISYGYSVVTGSLLASLIGVGCAILLFLLGLRISSMYLDAKPNRRANKRHRRIVRLGLIGYVLVVCGAFITVMSGFGNDSLWSFVYLVVCFVLLYSGMMQHYKWAGMRYVRRGNTLYATRPEKSIYFLKPLDERLNMLNVNTYRMAQTWFESRVLKMYRIKLSIDASMDDSEGIPEGLSDRKRRHLARQRLKEQMFWRHLKWLVDGPQLMNAIEQVSELKGR